MEDSEHVEAEDVITEMDNLNSIWSSYLAVHQTILDLAEDDAAYEEVIRHQIAFEEEYLSLKKGLGKLQRRIESTEHEVTINQQNGGNTSVIETLMQQQAQFLRAIASNAGASTSSIPPTNNEVQNDIPSLPDLRLPRMNLPIFSGNFLEWQSFYDLFSGSVHQNPSLRPSQKLYFLKTHLAGEAATLISHLNVEDANYQPALQKLRERYNKPREIANLHITRFLSQPHLTASSPSGLRSLHDVSDEVIRALAALEREGRDIWLMHIIYEKLDAHTKELWCQKIVELEEDAVSFDALLRFIDNRSSALQSSQRSRSSSTAPNNKPQISKPQYRPSSVLVATNQMQLNCGICSKPGHQPYQCGKFTHASSSDRFSMVSRQKLCQNCLRHHSGEACKAGSCRKCGLMHHTLLHNAFQPAAQFTSTEAPVSTPPQALISAINLADHLDGTNVLLLTATIDVFDKYGRPHSVRAVLDCASHLSFIRKDLCDQLGIEKSPINLDFQGISSTSSHSSMAASITIASRCSPYRANVPCAILDRISADLPLRPVNIDDWPIPDSVYLADPQFHNPGRVSMLLGLQPFLELLEPGRINLDSTGRLPILQNTKLGWVVSGRYEEPLHSSPVTSTCLITSVDDHLSRQLQKFFEMEEYVHQGAHFSEEEKACEAHFELHTIRDNAGRFQVRLPFREDPTLLGESRNIAIRRLEQIERKLVRTPLLMSQYHCFLREYLDAGHMSLAKTPAPIGTVYLPHHCVLKESSSTTKCRVVFDASAKTTSGKSLNDVLMTGPVLQDSLIDILLRFRFPVVALTGDIQQMYRMVQVAMEDRDYQRILWRWKAEDTIDEYTLNTVTYGTKTASYLATKCVQQLLNQYAMSAPTVVQKALKGTYVDDVLTGADSPEEAQQLRRQLSEIFASGGFHLRKWASNCTAALEGVPEADLEIRIPVELNGNETIKTLGIHWQPCSDEFLFSYQPHKILQPTKRIILSQIASLFDPLGLLAPIIIKAKLVMQRLWELKVDWDETPPGELINDWLVLAQNLSVLNSFQIPRRVINTQRPLRVYLHGYSDASERAMGACIYIRSVDETGNYSSHLLCAKSKTAPIGNGRSTIPRLELCAAVILARLINNVTAALSIQFHEIRAYSDSQVALAWIAGGASRWKTYVGNRVAEIVTHLPSVNWYHIGTHSNPADIISRGALPVGLQGNILWWHGPDWQHSLPLPELNVAQRQQVDRERKSVTVSLMIVYENCFLDEMLARYYPNKQMLLRVTARLLRFGSGRPGRLTAGELDHALMIYVRHTQQKHFLNDINRLKEGKSVHRGSFVYLLDPCLDDNGLLRVGGRLRQSKLSYDTKHQLLLPRHSILTSLILHDEHVHNLHCGPQTLLAVSRRRFWIPYGISAARKVFRQCITCARLRPLPLRQQMGQLPSARLEPQPPFSIVGIDYAGPVNIISRRMRGVAASKGYIALFVCFVTKAVSLEAVSDLSTSSFLAAFSRFTSRYGLPAKVYSDNATNFRAAAKQLKDIANLVNSIEHQSIVADFLADKGVEWNFIPPRSPHHGGLWEAGIKVAKQLLSKISGNFTYTFEELSTLLAQVAACMNSRPITPISNDPSDPEPLTPAHFLIGRPLTTAPEINQLERRISSMARWQFVQRASQEFRARWQREYVRSLQAFTKWQRSSANVNVGDFVLLVGENDKPKQWPLARVVAVHPGPDGLVRVVSLKTRNGIAQRDIRRIRSVPMDSDEYVPGRLLEEIPDRNLVGGLCTDVNDEQPSTQPIV
ncbi:uncharacterized protein LOC131688285 [Topomyia yanbarensis]|uniref:uncharacterized protein LOC131688285 n=1 Tax=Topomyia yanbarensis TaxID=2498891 RepID=UPI00273C2640|nr:uncharacterized protein LOC131688285 [Topomyia yanbarensis]